MDNRDTDTISRQEKSQEVSNNSPELDNNFGDLISRQAVLDAILNLNVENRVSWRDAVIDTIDALPPSPSRPQIAEPEQKTPKTTCPHCGWVWRTDVIDCCPNCGADMRT